MKSQKGFSVIEGLLILVIVGLLGGTGWYVWDSKKNSDKSLNTAAQTEIKTGAGTKTGQKDPTADWTAYSNKPGEYSLKYPSTWFRPNNEEFCTPELLMLGPTVDSTGKCASEAFGQISVTSVPGDYRTVNNFEDKYYKDIEKKSVEIGAVKGERLTGIAHCQEASKDDCALNTPDGTKEVKYIFYTNNRTYVATYRQWENHQDVLSDFDLMVTKTLKFSS